MVAPRIKSRVVKISWVITVVVMPAPGIAPIDTDVVAAVGVVGPRIIRVAAAAHVGMLHVPAVVPGVYDASSIVFPPPRPPAVDAVLNVHAASIDRTNRSVRTDARRPSAL